MLSTKRQFRSAEDVTTAVFSAWYVLVLPSTVQVNSGTCCILSPPDFHGDMPLTRSRAFFKFSLRREIESFF
jgi:hypothetical protein